MYTIYTVKFSPAPVTLGKALASKVELGLLPCEVAGKWETGWQGAGDIGNEKRQRFLKHSEMIEIDRICLLLI